MGLKKKSKKKKVITIKKYNKEIELKFPAPKYFCNSCDRCYNKRCSFFDRPIIPDYNRCYYHSKYSPVAIKFKAPDNLEQIIKEEEEKKAI